MSTAVEEVNIKYHNLDIQLVVENSSKDVCIQINVGQTGYDLADLKDAIYMEQHGESVFQFIAVNMALHLRMLLHIDPRYRLFKPFHDNTSYFIVTSRESGWTSNYQKEKKANMKIRMRNESTKSTTLFRNSSSKRVGLIEPVKEDMTLESVLTTKRLSRTGRSLSRKFSMLRIVMLLERTLLNFLRRQSRQNLNLL